MLAKVLKPKQSRNEIGDNYDELWHRIRKGNKDALSELFCHLYAPLFNYGYKIDGREAFIKDCIQELFLTIWENRNSINDTYSVKTYLFYSLRRLIFRKLTKQKNRLDRNWSYTDNFFEEIYNIEDLMIHFETKQEKKKKLSRALDRLTQRQKEAIFLRFYDGFSNTEVAKIMEINRQSVYNHVSKAIETLQRFIVA